MYQELSYQEGENVPEGDDANDIAGIVYIENCLCISLVVLTYCLFSLDCFKWKSLMAYLFKNKFVLENFLLMLISS